MADGTMKAPEKLIVESLVLNTIISGNTGTLTTYNGRKISDYKLLMFIMRAGSEGRIRDSKIIYPSALGSIMLYAHHGETMQYLSGMTVAKTSETTFSVEKNGEKSINGIEVIGVTVR